MGIINNCSNLKMREKLKILIVDDNVDLLDLYSTVLQKRGFLNTLQCSNGAAALRLLGHINVEVILSDIVMPHFSGMELYKMVRQREEYSHIKFLVNSGNRNGHTNWLVKADGYFSKPMDFDLLTQTLDGFASTSESDGRLCKRVQNNTLVSVMADANFFYSINNVSFSGLSIKSWKELDVGKIIPIECKCNLFSKQHDDFTIREGEIVWREQIDKGCNYGVKFKECLVS